MKKILLNEKWLLCDLYNHLLERAKIFINKNRSWKISNIKKEMSENILVDFKADIFLYSIKKEKEVLVYNENDWWGVSYKSSLYMEVDEMFSPFKFIFIYLLNGSNVSVIHTIFKMDDEEEEKAYQEFYNFIDRLKLESS